MAEASLYERLGGVFAIAAVVDQFSDAVIANPKVGQGSENPQLDAWSTKRRDRLAGLKFMRTLWVCNVAGGPFEYVGTKPGSTAVGLEEAHRALRSRPASSTRSPRSWHAPGSRFRSGRRARSSRRSPRTRARSSTARPGAGGAERGLPVATRTTVSVRRELAVVPVATSNKMPPAGELVVASAKLPMSA